MMLMCDHVKYCWGVNVFGKVGWNGTSQRLQKLLKKRTKISGTIPRMGA